MKAWAKDSLHVLHLPLLKLNLEFIVETVLRENEELLISLQRKQMYTGKTAQGGDIKPEYTDFTKNEKSGKGQPSDRVTLYDEGDFYGKQFAIFSKKDAKLSSRDVKLNMLIEKYSSEIFGLNQDSIEKLLPLIQPLIIEEIHKQLFS